jgi:hypothetical protein
MLEEDGMCSFHFPPTNSINLLVVSVECLNRASIRDSEIRCCSWFLFSFSAVATTLFRKPFWTTASQLL